jgi:hypothetical protein
MNGQALRRAKGERKVIEVSKATTAISMRFFRQKWLEKRMEYAVKHF